MGALVTSCLSTHDHNGSGGEAAQDIDGCQIIFPKPEALNTAAHTTIHNHTLKSGLRSKSLCYFTVKYNS